MSAPFPLFSWLADDLADVVVFVRLYQSINPSSGSPSLTDFVEANYPGYVPQLVPVPPPVTELPNGSLYLAVAGMTWTVEKSRDRGCAVQGLFLSSAEPDAVNRLVAWTAFDQTYPMFAAGDWIVTDFSLAAFQLLTPSA
jgi:hypothetical protein